LSKEWAAIILLLLRGFIVGLGWVAGLVLLWSSRAWSTRDKWVGTLVVPGGLVGQRPNMGLQGPMEMPRALTRFLDSCSFAGLFVMGAAGFEPATSRV
jgi:hypothetical protein